MQKIEDNYPPLREGLNTDKNAVFGGDVTISGSLTTTGVLGVTGVTISAGAGAPSHSAAKGSLYLNTTGSSSSTRLYVNNGTTTWVAVTTAT